ncbi:MAG: 4-phosphopantetheinyl transferase family protein [Spirochaetales bacterium]|nr:4-phosphopantetheinyl transferase family protein [Spirochaetales bacterium]
MRLSIFLDRTLVGNDVVDLELTQALGKIEDERFIARVFSPEEQRVLAAADEPDRWLWTLWAAKEASFKAAQKLNPDLVFSPRRFVVFPLTSASAEVRLDDRVIQVVWTWGPGWVHSLAVLGKGQAEFCVEQRPPEANESIAVRELGQRFMAERGWDRVEFRRAERTDRRALWPQAFQGQALVPADLSFSHDGRWVAFALGETWQERDPV